MLLPKKKRKIILKIFAQNNYFVIIEVKLLLMSGQLDVKWLLMN